MSSDNHSPRLYHGVMISSTFTDLEHHRAALIKAVEGQEFKGVVMENDSAKPDVDVIESSLRMVRDASAYIVLISHKYGQTPVSADRNPQKLSITELEFDEAQRLNRPTLLFIMGDKHPVLSDQVESNSAKRRKLTAFRERAKKMRPDSQVHRVYDTFNSLEDFKEKAIQAVAELRRHLDKTATSPPAPVHPSPAPIPAIQMPLNCLPQRKSLSAASLNASAALSACYPAGTPPLSDLPAWAKPLSLPKRSVPSSAKHRSPSPKALIRRRCLPRPVRDAWCDRSFIRDACQQARRSRLHETNACQGARN